MKNTFTHHSLYSYSNTFPSCSRKTRKNSSRRRLRLQYGGYPNRSAQKRRTHKKAGKLVSTLSHSPYGMQWDRQSCWMDASLMSLFYPDAMYNAIFPMIQSNTNNDLDEVKQTLLQTISELREPHGEPHLHGLRSMLADCIQTRDQRYAFQVENQLGYVFYFIQELLKLFDVSCTRAIPPHGKNYKKLYVMEMEYCNNNTVEQCLQSTYEKWNFHDDIAKYMIIELIDEDGKFSVKPQENIHFLDYDWTLSSMVVFDCSHFVSYVKEGEQWYLYDDTRSLSHQELDPYEFGSFYSKGSCQFQYGKNNTFFFYTRS